MTAFVLGKLYFVLPLMFFTALAGFKIPRRKYFILRFLICISLSVAEILLFTFFFGHKPLNFFILYVMAIAMMLVCFRCSIWTALFCATVGYCIEHVSERIYELCVLPLPSEYPMAVNFLIRTAVLAAAGAAVWFFIVRKSGEKGIVVDNVLQILAVIIISPVIIYLNEKALTIVRPFRSPEANFILYLISAMYAFVGILFEYSMCARKQSETELVIIRRILREEREKYNREKTNIEWINIKCHDLRHQIAAYREKLDHKELQSIYKAIEIYDSDITTGCNALDVVINEKMPRCRENGIKLTCLIDGEKLLGFPEHEIYSLFGNALENAIDAVIELPPEKRVISITDRKVRGLICICVENYFIGSLKFHNGLPETTKEGEGHGYGVKSIKYIAELHGGAVNVVTDGDIFRLLVSIPLPSADRKDDPDCNVRRSDA